MKFFLTLAACLVLGPTLLVLGIVLLLALFS